MKRLLLQLGIALSISVSPFSIDAANAWNWVPWGIEHGGTLPPNSFIGGSETVLNSGGRVRQLYICQIEDGLKGVHPGKVVEGYCNIGYDSKELKYGAYRVLTDVDPTKVKWIPASNGNVPAGAFEGGQEPRRVLYICRGSYKNGVNPGKVVDNACNIPWGGGEPHLQNYEVLVIGR
jgi:DM9 repeat